MLADFHWDEAKKKNFFLDSKKLRFLTFPILNIFLRKFHGLVLGLVGSIDVKAINVAQPIWLPGFPT